MTSAIFSIFLLTIAVWILGKFSPIKICPVCAGVSLTWLWLLVGLFLGQLPTADYQLPAALLIGGTVVGLAFKLESLVNPRWLMIWKTVFIALGFAGAYSLIRNQWLYFFLFLIGAFVTSLIFKNYVSENQANKNENPKQLKKKLKHCC